MPKGSVPRYKVIHCRSCGKIIKRFDRSKYAGWHVPPDVITSSIRKHYKDKHPSLFKKSIRKAVRARKK